ncbi:MAG: putative Ig domain-containing protein, partial [Actinomycetota bacterium]
MRRFSQTVVGTVLAMVLVLGITSTVAAAPVADQAADGLQDAASIDLLRGPSDSSLGETVDIIITPPADAVAFEAVIDVADDALDFGGLYPAEEQTTVRFTGNATDQIAVAAVRCADTACDRGLTAALGPITARFAVSTPGAHRIRLSRAVAIDADGTATTLADGVLTVTVDGADPATGGADPAPLADRPAASVPGAAADVSGEGVVSGMDVTEALLAWSEVRQRTQPCELQTERLQRADVDGNGCIDMADVVAVARAARLAPPRPPLDPNSDRAVNGPTPMVVNSTSDEWDANLNNGVCNTPSGGCSLRAAILQANANPGPDIIHFAIPGNGPHTINLGSSLPTLNDTTGGTRIDGFTQPGASVNTSPTVSNANIRIQIRGTGNGAGNVTLRIASAGNEVRGLAMYRAFWNIQLTGNGATGNRIVGNHIGTNAAATEDPTSGATDQAGIEIGNQASNNAIGTPALADRNVISGNYYSGIRINHAGTKGNYVQNNLVGLHPNGNSSLYTRVAGVDIQWGAEENWVGGYQRYAGNVVTGVANYGIDLSHSSKNNRIAGNLLGTDATGTNAPNHAGNLIGLAIKDNTVGNLIEQNVIGGNNREGIWHRHNFTGINTFRGNRIGVGVDGSNVGNASYGIYLSGHDDFYEGNLIAYNGDDGVYINNFNGGNGFSPPEYTERNELSRNGFFDNADRAIRIVDGTQNGIASPSIGSASTGSASGSACGGCRVELYGADGAEGRVFLAATTAAGNGSWSISSNRIRNTAVVALAIRSNGDTSEFGNQVSVGSTANNATPSIGAIANRGSLRYQFTSFTVSASDGDNNPLHFSAYGLPAGVDIDPATGVISGRPGSVGPHDVRVRVDDSGRWTQRSFVWTVTAENVAPTVSAPAAVQLVDDFESNSGWQTNPAGSDTATTGQWGIGTLEASPTSNGTRLQLGSTPSGSGALATDRRAGSSTGTYDIDGGVTTVRSPAIAVPADATTLTFQHYFAHLDNATADDVFRAWIVAGNGSRSQVFAKSGNGAVVAAAWREASIDVSPWAGTTIRLEFEASDNAGGSLVEAAVDDVAIASGTWSGSVGDSVGVQVPASDGNGDSLTFSATGLPGGLSISNSGFISGTLNGSGNFTVTVTVTDPGGLRDSVQFPWNVDGPGGGGGDFSCTVSGNTLTWTNQGASRYYIRQLTGGNDTYLGSTTTTTF